MIAALDQAIRYVCPIHGASIGCKDDRSTWSFQPTPDATPEQITAARRAVAEFDLLAVEKIRLRSLVDDDAERVRLRYITPGVGMAMTYQEKFTQAQAINALGQEAANALKQEQCEAAFPTLAASVGIEAATLWDCSQLVLLKFTQFASLSMTIERVRLAGKKSISDASDAAAARAAYEAIKWPT